MQLTRRDAVAALAAIGAAGGVGAGVARWQSGERGVDIRETMVAVAEVVYPTEVSGIEAFVSGYLEGRLDDSDRAEELRETVATLDERARSWYDAPVPELEPGDRDELLRGVGADTADSDPQGTTAERVRYYVVNELLLALYASPTGGELVGIENPPGHPGGITSYARGSQ
ncbi:gluconate 2-dehydrogenase subunit 3 family protein [Halococcoides cellulosivorans]|uniref:Gluconate 2-dehydrogenase subunit 3 family protein n=1 Tax=Halococcoides cellulosivorans TaxID=1679096 RepID=A0A2R4WY82_9EURY|nr:gluconate 2-dehydrogenase subunit 3 family protein [Halococcoides cellulosivorans]AWB26481.1 hypothetical protein HARCEL1_01485 [Halococcoides cellulosivorans]